MNQHPLNPANCHSAAPSKHDPSAGGEPRGDAPVFDAGVLNAKAIQRLRTVPDSCPTRRVETAGDFFWDHRDDLEELAQSEHPRADLFQGAVDQLDQMESARDELYMIREDPSSYDADDKAAAREAVLYAFETVADALDALQEAVAPEGPAAPSARPAVRLGA